jgi:hypothetical protein
VTAKRSTTKASVRVATWRILTGLSPGFHSVSSPTIGGKPSRVVGLLFAPSTAFLIRLTSFTLHTWWTFAGATGGSGCPRFTPTALLVSAAGPMPSDEAESTDNVRRAPRCTRESGSDLPGLKPIDGRRYRTLGVAAGQDNVILRTTCLVCYKLCGRRDGHP